jgi:uncharacterized repeat protein (TIGR03803 family)
VNFEDKIMNKLNYFQNGMLRLHLRRFSAVFVVAGLLAANTEAQNLNLLWNFNPTANSGGADPRASMVQGPDGTLYGTTQGGGVVFKIHPDGTGFAALKDFADSAGPYSTTNSDGTTPVGRLVLSGNTLYGAASSGGNAGEGTLFKVNTDGTGFAVLYNFSARGYYWTGSGYSLTNGDGASPQGGLVLSGNVLYGAANLGGSANNGTVFEINSDGTGFSTLYNFKGYSNSDGANPAASLLLSDNTLYGTAESGGQNGFGTVFKVNTDGSSYANLYSFTNNDSPRAELIQSGNVLYGTTFYGGSYGNGSVFKINTDGSGFGVVHSFLYYTDGSYLDGGLCLSGDVLYGTTSNPFGDGTVFEVNTDGSGFNTLRSFSGSDGTAPYGGLVLSGGTLYGTASGGGDGNNGTIFSINTDGTSFTTIESFPISVGVGSGARLLESNGKLYGSDSSGIFRINPDGSGYTNLNKGLGGSSELTIASNTLYGTTFNRGSNDVGSVFKINPDGSGYTLLHSCEGGNDASPESGLVVSNGVLYGTTYGDFSDIYNPFYGAVFKMNSDGTCFTNLYTFTNGLDGANPYGSLLLSGSTLYGTTTGIHGANYGSVFKINTNGSGFAVLKTFLGGDGANPFGGLVLSGSTLYGTTESGTPGYGTIFKVNASGGGFATLHSFYPFTDGSNPYGTLTLSGTTLYGTANAGGYSGNGTIFKINTSGAGFTVLTNFPNGLTLYDGPDGASPVDLILYGGALYGTTAGGGNYGQGVLFSWTLPGYPINLSIQSISNAIMLGWNDPASSYSLQAAPSFNGAYTNVSGAKSPYTYTITGSQMFFRLIAN